MKMGSLMTDEYAAMVAQEEAAEREAAKRVAERQEKWDRRFLMLAQVVATWSKDPSTQVGVVIVDFNRRVVSTGYNGFPRGMNDADELYAQREEKYERVMHAEMNAIIQAARDVRGYTMYCSALPCHKCALGIIQAGIARLVAPPAPADLLSRWEASFSRMYGYFKEAGVTVVELDQ